MGSRVAIIPAYQAASTIGNVVTGLIESWSAELATEPRVVVVDDGSTDETSLVARRAGAEVLRHPENRGKGAALTTGLLRARELEFGVAVTLDADGQHPPSEAVRLLEHPAPDTALVLGIRDLAKAGAPKANRFSNAFSNAWLSGFSGKKLLDTQCGLRRYPVQLTLDLGVRSSGFGFEAEVLLRAARAGIRLEQEAVSVIYPPAETRTTHFHSVRDPFRIVLRVLHTAATAGRR